MKSNGISKKIGGRGRKKQKKLSDVLNLKFFDMKYREECGFGRYRQALSNEYLIAAIGLDTADNGPIKVWG